MIKKHYYYIECTFDENGKNWQRWSEENYLSFSKIKTDVWKLSQQESEYNQHQDSPNPLVQKIQGFRIIQETVEVQTQTISEYILT